MPRINNIILIVLSVLLSIMFFSCEDNKREPVELNMANEILSSDTALHLMNGVLFYHSKPFNGNIKELYADGKTKSIQHLKDGKQEGLSESFYEDGKPESARWYIKGEKDSVHCGWWWNGNKKYEYHFKNGSYNGMFTEWYQSGKMLQQVMYQNGNELFGKGWRETGKPYMNYVMKNGRRYGLYNSNLCYTLSRENLVE